jgi:hypothetical protein
MTKDKVLKYLGTKIFDIGAFLVVFNPIVSTILLYVAMYYRTGSINIGGEALIPVIINIVSLTILDIAASIKSKQEEAKKNTLLARKKRFTHLDEDGGINICLKKGDKLKGGLSVIGKIKT